MINGHLLEAQQGFAILEDVDEGTFVRFIRWAYNKDYPAPDYLRVEDSTQKPTTETAKEKALLEDDLIWAEWGSYTTKKKDKKKKRAQPSASAEGYLKESFITQYDGLSQGLSIDTAIPGPRGNKTPDENYTEVFLGHARMYVFAEKYDIQTLKQLALMKLHHTLSIFTLFPERVADITTLVKYVYANTTETLHGTEDIRTMLAHYVGCEMEMLSKDGEIKDLMLENGDMLGDFLNMFALRVS